MRTVETTQIECDVMRRYDCAAPCYLVLLCVGMKHACHARGVSAYPHAQAVVNDFGDLVCVTPWSLW